MQLPWNSKYIAIIFHILLSICILLIFLLALYLFFYQRSVLVHTLQAILSVFSPVLWSLAITLFLEPLVAYWHKRYISFLSKHQKAIPPTRHVAAAISYIIIVLVFIVLIWMGFRLFGTKNLTNFITQISLFLQKISDWIILLQLKLIEFGYLQNAENLVAACLTKINMQLKSIIFSLAQALPTFGGQILHILIGFTAAFYFLSEKNKILQTFTKISQTFLGIQHTHTLGIICHKLYFIWIGYLSGQFFDALIMSILFSLTFWLIGIPYGIWIGLISGFSNFIPYFGAVVAFCLALLSGLFSDSPIRALYAAIAILILQQIDSAIIIPRVLGERISLHPVFVLFSLSVFGGLFGFWGLLFAVPLGAVCKSVFDWLYMRKQRKNQAM